MAIVTWVFNGVEESVSKTYSELRNFVSYLEEHGSHSIDVDYID
ncbi:hypothetical protein [Pseudoalteromonas nigrifaciens]